MAKLFTQIGVPVILADDNESGRERATAATGVEAVSTATARERFSEVGAVVTSPGWRPDSPLLSDAALHGLEVLGDVEACYRLDRAGVFGDPRDWLVVTGTNGKTTTTGMLAAMMAELGADTGKRAQACGNIGLAVADALTAEPRVDVLVAELSSFQLYWSSELTPDAGVLLNLADDHIDWHGSFDHYAAAKARVLTAGHAVAGIDDAHVRALVAATGREDVVGFTLGTPADGDVGLEGGRLVSRIGGEALDLASADGIEPAGAAGILDALAAAAVALTQGAQPKHIQAALDAYRVEGHRGAVVHSAGGVDWVDNSKATNPHAADSALTGAGTVVWVAGGQLKGAAVDELIAAHAHQFRAVALLGVDREILREAVARLAPGVPVYVADSTDPVAAMDDVCAFAAAHAQPGDTVLLAPAAASLDMYSGMSARGDEFAAAAMRHC
ncbi:UDP-N-acetylmuramoyl-L-alanine--D-glutamate ligase [Corynebacterium sp. TA-R-1]|uniref:UDP-N-acetylmuramoylalanine--D-glutamate ligase n=2 Tax=Corynebacterium stercoris TaxID=2943490 RepID=A0ABT1G178_9CORY|nr:UDP-N-acetylmuramoyl-L-alanine--D-glutamate ligase [Corynebacterium stercoris]